MTRGSTLWMLLLLCGCEPLADRDRLEREPSGPAAAGEGATEIPEVLPKTPVAGELGGEPFRAKSARYHVERFPGRERVDIFLSEAPAPSQCAEPGRSGARSVWMRFDGITSLRAGGLSAAELSEQVTFHYEQLREGLWRGGGGGEGRVQIEREGASNVEGRLYVCFPGASGGCVGGRFEADRCRSVLDVDGAGGGLTGREALPPGSE